MVHEKKKVLVNFFEKKNTLAHVKKTNKVNQMKIFQIVKIKIYLIQTTF